MTPPGQDSADVHTSIASPLSIALVEAPGTSFDFVTDPLSIEAEWWDLWQRSGGSPFQSPAWLMPWNEQFGGRESGVLVVRAEHRALGMLPLFRLDGRWLPWGAGVTDWIDGIFAPDLDPALPAGAVAGLDAPLDLFQLPSGSPLLTMSCPNGWSDSIRTAEPCVALSLPAVLPRKITHNLAYYRRRAAQAGIGEPTLASGADFEALVDLHTRRWASQGASGVLSDGRVLAWHRLALPRLEAAGLLRLYTLARGGEVVGALYALSAHRRTSYYIGGFDPELDALGLGTILIGHAIEQAEHEGARSFDFLRGRESYKYHWGASDTQSYARTLTPPDRVDG